jgi:cupin 2 domain-containing protein
MTAKTKREGNLFAGLPDAPAADERFDAIVDAPHLRIERIVSTGQATPEGEWFDQDRDEWVVLLQGAAALLLEGEAEERVMTPGDWLLIPAHRRHRVTRTTPDEPTVWLAVHYTG